MNEYDRLVNSKWQALSNDEIHSVDPKIAERFAKKSWRRTMKKKFPYKIKLTSGNRKTWVRSGVLNINPENGWKEIVHLWSHWIGYCKRLKPHGNDHLRIERDLTDLAIAEFVGKKSSQKEMAPKPSLQEKRAESVCKRLAAWEARKKRVDAAIKKLRRKKTYYDKALAKNLSASL